MNYLFNTSNSISKIKRFPQALDFSFKSNSKWQNIKKFHLLEKEKTNDKFSNFCKDSKFAYKPFNYILEPINEKVNVDQTTIYKNDTYRLSAIDSKHANLK